MIDPITYRKTIKTLAWFLDTYSYLPVEKILNGDSIRGTDLSVFISESQSYSIEAGSSFILFELLEDLDSDHYITPGSIDNSMLTIQSYLFHLKIYGNTSPEDAQRISSIFKKGDLVLELRNKGIYINGVLPIDPINEFINNTYILRRDLTIKLQTVFEFNDLGEDSGYFADNQKIDLIVKETTEIN